MIRALIAAGLGADMVMTGVDEAGCGDDGGRTEKAEGNQAIRESRCGSRALQVHHDSRISYFLAGFPEPSTSKHISDSTGFHKETL
jgi:hypothetical protein